MKKKLYVIKSLVVAFALVATQAWAKVTAVDIAELKPTQQHRQTVSMVSQIVQKFHYVKPKLNDDISGQIFDRYLEALDANKSFFSQEEIDQLSKYRYSLDDMLRSGRIDPAFEIFRLFRTLVEQRTDHALKLLAYQDYKAEHAAVAIGLEKADSDNQSIVSSNDTSNSIEEDESNVSAFLNWVVSKVESFFGYLRNLLQGDGTGSEAEKQNSNAEGDGQGVDEIHPTDLGIHYLKSSVAGDNSPENTVGEVTEDSKPELYKLDFNRDENYRFDRSDAKWTSTQIELEDVWRKRLKNDILSLQLAGKSEQEIDDTLRKRYEGISRRVRQMTPDDVFQTFVNSYTLTIEPHTSYMSPQVSENFDITMRLSLQGIGAVLRSKNEHTLIQSIVAGGPADNSGQLHPGDRIVGVAQDKEGEMEDVVGWRLQDVVEKIRGPKDSVVRLSVLPKSQGLNGKTRTVVIVRDEIKLEDKAAKSEIIEGHDSLHGLRIGVIEIPAFYRDFNGAAAGDPNFRSTTRDVRKLLEDLQKENVDGVVVDLRSNGGGSLTEATELTGLFIDEGPVVQVRGTKGDVEIEADTDPTQAYVGPLAVLVDRNSASASEIFAGAIQDYKRGLIIGEPTYGKGTVQTLVEIGRFLRTRQDLGRLRLTMAQFFRVDGGSTQHKGVMPDFLFPTAKGAAEHGERALDNALPWASISPASYKTAGVTSVAGIRDEAMGRIKDNPGFDFLIEQEEEIMELDDRHVVSLNPAKRKEESDRRDKNRLERLNRLRVYRGLEPLESLEDDDEDFVEADEEDQEGIQRVMLDESANILADYIVSRRPRTVLKH